MRWLLGLALCLQIARADPVLPVTLDSQGPYLILATRGAAERYAPAIRRAVRLHPGCKLGRLDPAHPKLAKGPRYVLVFLLPQELNERFAWSWMELTALLDNDPFVDTRTGFMTGDATEAYFVRLEKALRGQEKVPARMVDNLGPASTPQEMTGSFFLPALAGRLPTRSFSHLSGQFPERARQLSRTAGILHLGGHGDPAGVPGGMQAGDWSDLSPALVFNGCCYGGVTNRQPSFCLAALRRCPLAYFASLYPDHGMPVYQEIERLALSGGSTGDIIKGTQDEVILGLGGGPFRAPGKPSEWTASQQMLYGTASRVLFGDPAVRPELPRVPGAFRITQDTAVLVNPGLPSTLTDTFHGDLCSQPNMFNARAMLEWPARRGSLSSVEVETFGKKLRHRVVAAAVEDGRVLRVQVDIESQGLFQTPFRTLGALVRCRFANK